MTEKEAFLQKIQKDWNDILLGLEEVTSLQPDQILVIGCSSSEIIGQRIGTAGSKEVAETLAEPLLTWAARRQVYLAFQCCEHLNRALVVEKACAESYQLEPVMVLPSLKAGGAMSLAAWERMKEPVMVERIQAHAGIDIGDTFIGMHLRPVVVPVRLAQKSLGNAHVTIAKTRPKYIGGPRALYA